MLRRTASGSVSMSWPFTVAVPLVGLNNVDSMLSVVVLPAPLGPRNPRISPSSTLKLIPSTALTSLSKILVSALTSMVLTLFRPPI